MSQFIALDLGAESGRAIVGKIKEERLTLEEVHRFPNGVVPVMRGLYWDPLHLIKEIKNGLRKISHEFGQDFVSVGLDTWGIDYALLDEQGQLVGNPHSYRDPRTEGMMDLALQRVSKKEIYERSAGIQFLSINALYQLFSMVVHKSPQLDIAHTFLMIPDLFNYWLTGVKACEFTDVTTTQFYDAARGEWSRELLNKLDIPDNLFPEVIQPGTKLGTLLPEVADDVSLPGLQVIAPACHDTASAAAAIPAAGEGFAWLSSGTWSLPGAVSDHPLVSDEAMQANISSYGGIAGTFLPWKNIMGLWLVQECRRIWSAAGESFSYDQLTQMAASAPPFTAVIDPDHPSFLAPKDMPAAIRARCQDMGQTIPGSKGELVRIVLEGLALKYRWVIERLQSLLSCRFNAIHVVGGGSQNQLLCQFTADATGIPVVAGPVEATAIGNIVVQAMATGYLRSLSEARQLVRRSFDVVTFEPRSSETWDEAYEYFCQHLTIQV